MSKYVLRQNVFTNYYLDEDKLNLTAPYPCQVVNILPEDKGVCMYDVQIILPDVYQTSEVESPNLGCVINSVPEDQLFLTEEEAYTDFNKRAEDVIRHLRSDARREKFMAEALIDYNLAVEMYVGHYLFYQQSDTDKKQTTN